MFRPILVSIALSIPGVGIAAPLELIYAGVVTQATGAGTPAVGSSVLGRIVFDSSPDAYGTCTGAPLTTEYQARCMSAAPYGSWLETSVHNLSGSSFSLEVFDNDLNLIGISAPGDLITFSARRPGLFYSLWLAGPQQTFAGTDVPTIALLESLLPQAVVRGSGDLGATFAATITSYSISAVPEPATPVALLSGLALVGYLRRHKRDA